MVMSSVNGVVGVVCLYDDVVLVMRCVLFVFAAEILKQIVVIGQIYIHDRSFSNQYRKNIAQFRQP